MTKKVPSENRVSGSRLARMDKIKNLLKSHSGPMTAKQIARALGDISVRQVQRDIDALELYRVPIIRVQGRGGGYYLPEEYKLTPDPFDGDEVGSLSVGGMAVYGHIDLIMEEALQTALAKITASLSEADRRKAQAVAERVYFDHSKWYLKYYTSPLLETLKQAVLSDSSVELTYIEWNDPLPQIDAVEAYGLVCKADTWYFVGLSKKTNIMRRFNLFRILEVRDTGSRFQRLSNFSLREFWRQDLEEFGKGDIKAVIIIGWDAWDRLKNLTWKRDNIFEPVVNGMKVTMKVHRYEWIIDLVLVNRGEVIALEPLELRDHIAQIARRIFSSHSTTEPFDKLDLSPDSGVIGLEILESMSITSDS